jgi:hypothetical protein
MLKCVLLIAGGNWNDGTNTGVSYRNANNVAAKQVERYKEQIPFYTKIIKVDKYFTFS